MTPSLTYLAVRSDKYGTITIGSTLPRDELDRRMLTPGEVLVQAFQQFAAKSGIHTYPGAQHIPALQLVHDLASPDGWGHAVPADLRREAGRVLEESRGEAQAGPAVALKAVPAAVAVPSDDRRYRTDAQIVDQTVALTKYLLDWKWGLAPEGDASRIWESENSKALVCWNAACHIQDLLTQTDVWNAVANIENEEAEPTTQLPAVAQEPSYETIQAMDKAWHDVCHDTSITCEAKWVRFYRAAFAGRPAPQPTAAQGAALDAAYQEFWDAELGRAAMRFVDRAGDVHPGVDDAETICAEFHAAMSAVIERMPHLQRMNAANEEARAAARATREGGAA